MTAKQFAGWEHYAALEPFGEVRGDWRAASIREMIYNMAVDPKHKKPLKDFLLKFEAIEAPKASETPPAKQSIEEQIRIIRIIAATGGCAAA